MAERPSGAADKEMGGRGSPMKEEGSMPRDTAEWETWDRSGNEPLLELDWMQNEHQAEQLEHLERPRV